VGPSTVTLSAVTIDKNTAPQGDTQNRLPAFKAIAAIDEGRGLGIAGDLPWHLPEDLKHFARTTTKTENEGAQNAVIMGRLTCETIPGKYWPLKNRRNAVITRNREWSIEGADVFADLPSALLGLTPDVETLYVVGGGQIYSLAIALEACEELILTRIHKRYACDAFFPEYENNYDLYEKLGDGEHDGVAYTFESWRRKGL
jgi:dihydrofolate reductase